MPPGPPKFGTSGLRGLVADLTADHVQAFLRPCPVGHGLHIGHDLRQSSPAIAAIVGQTAQRAGLAITDCAALPTPALALAAMRAGAAYVARYVTAYGPDALAGLHMVSIRIRPWAATC